VRVAFFGRLDTTKGVDTLISALAARPNLNVALDIYSPPPTDATHAYASKIEMAASADARIHLCAPLAENDVITAMARYDLIAVPSRWLESGPLVVLEAFAAGIPVLGARLGGIAELVSDGVDGVLAPHDDIEAWACALDALASDRGRLAQLRGGVKPPRTMEDVADDMVRLYGALTLVSGDEHASA
jgi:glycosyltransferase involved in cell wall biosynthesis